MKNTRVVNRPQKIQTVFLYIVFICYILFLMKLLLFSRVTLDGLFHNQRVVDRSINLIPFHSIKEYLFSDSATIKRFAFANVAGNSIAFVPLGAFLSLFKPNRKVSFHLLIVFSVSLSVEVIHGVLGIGAADIDDIILNCLGGLIGILGYQFLQLILRNEKNVRIAATIVSAMGLPYLLFLLFRVKLRL